MGEAENNTTKEIIEYYNLLGWYLYRNNTGRRGKVNYGHVGSGDIIGLTNMGVFVSIEVKSETGKPSDKQKEFISEVKKRKGFACVARSVEDVQKEFNKWN